MAQLQDPRQRGLKGLADRPAGLLQAGQINCCLLVAVPVGKQLPLQLQQFRSEFGTGDRAFDDGGEIPNHMGLADLASLQREVVVEREAIAHHNPAKGAPEQLDGGGRRATQTLDEHGHHGRHHDPLPAQLPGGIVAVGIAGGSAGFVDVGHRLRTGKAMACRIGCSKAELNRLRIDAIAPRLISTPRS